MRLVHGSRKQSSDHRYLGANPRRPDETVEDVLNDAAARNEHCLRRRHAGITCLRRSGTWAFVYLCYVLDKVEAAPDNRKRNSRCASCPTVLSSRVRMRANGAGS